MMGTAPPDAVHELLDLTDELVCVFMHLPSIRDFGRASCVCRAWRADGSPVEQALRKRIKVRDGKNPTTRDGETPTMQQMCWSELLRDARMASGAAPVPGCSIARIPPCRKCLSFR